MIVSMTPQFVASLTDDSGDVIYDCNKFIIQAFDCLACLREHHQQSYLLCLWFPVTGSAFTQFLNKTKGLYYKTFYGCNVKIFVIS